MKKILKRILLTMVTLLLLVVVVAAAAMRYTASCPALAPIITDGTGSSMVVQDCYGGTDVLHLEPVNKPEPGDDEILVRVAAAGVNPLDWHVMRGKPYFMRLMTGIGRPAERRFGVDFAGEVEAVGSAVTQFKPGDRVFGGRTGAFANYLIVRETSALALLPDTVTFEEAAGIGVAAITALQALRDSAKVESGQRVLINGASGGVGTFAVQIAKNMGAEVYGVCSTRNVDRVRALGADHVIDYTKDDYTESDMTFDAIVDLVGNHGLSANRRVLKENGKMVIVAGGKGDWLGPMANPLKSVFVDPFTDQTFQTLLAELNQHDLQMLAELMRYGTINTVIDRTYPMAEFRDAIEYSESGRARGKIILVP